jgi:hypothetical protein
MNTYENFSVISRADQITRWEQAIRVLESLKPHERRKHFDMSVWGKKTPCGTIACAAGYCGLDRWFRKNGFRMDFKLRTRILRGETASNDNDRDLEGYWGPPIKVEYVETEISDVEKFFGSDGSDGSDGIFFNSKRRSVDKVIKQMKKYLAKLKKQP